MKPLAQHEGGTLMRKKKIFLTLYFKPEVGFPLSQPYWLFQLSRRGNFLIKLSRGRNCTDELGVSGYRIQ